MVIHFSYASLAYGTVMRTFWLNAAALRTLKEHLTLFEAKLLDHFFSSVTFRYGTLKSIKLNYYFAFKLYLCSAKSYRIRKHCSHMRCKSQKRKHIKDDHVYSAVNRICMRTGQHNDRHYYKFCVKDQHPGHDSTNYATDVLQQIS